MSISGSIIIGIVSGLITSSVIYLCIQIFQKIIKPWYQDFIYSGVRIDGQWINQKTFREGDTIQDELLDIKQHAYKIIGTRTITKRYQSKEGIEIKIFNVKGQIKDRFVYLISENTDCKKIGVSCGLYEVKCGGDELQGSDMWTDIGSNDIVHIQVKLERK